MLRETDFALALLDISADGLYDLYKFICSQMRFLDIQDFFRGACPDKNLQHLCISSLAVLNQGIQFSIGESPCASLSELDIALCIQLSCFPEMVYFFYSPVRIVSTFQKNGPQPCPDQIISAEKSRRPASYDHRTAGLQIFLCNSVGKTQIGKLFPMWLT